MLHPHGRIGHVALRVRLLAVSVPFYTQVLDLREVAWLDEEVSAIVGGETAFLSFGSNHHDLALLEAPKARPSDPACAGLVHVALCIDDHIETLRAMHARLLEHDVALSHGRDHEVSPSLYLRHLDGLLIELFVDADPALCAARLEAMATVRPPECNRPAGGLPGTARPARACNAAHGLLRQFARCAPGRASG